MTQQFPGGRKLTDDFIIAGYVGNFSFDVSNQADPVGDEAFLIKMKNCGFNILATSHGSANHAADGTLSFGQIVYLLQRLRKVGGMRAFILDTILWGDALSDAIPGQMQSYSNLESSFRDIIYAYQIMDEPGPDIPNGDDPLTRTIEKTGWVMEGDPEKTAFINLVANVNFSGWVAEVPPQYLQDYVDRYFQFIQDDFDVNQNKKKPYLVSFDNYPFNASNSYIYDSTEINNFPPGILENANGFRALGRATVPGLPVTYF